MKWRPDWDLSTIPDALLKSEYKRRLSLSRRSFRGGRKPSCDCGECRTCKAREYQRRRRAAARQSEPPEQKRR